MPVSPSISASVGRLQLRNPTMLASGILGETAESMIRVYRSGAAAVVTKSIGEEPREGYGNPTVYLFEGGMLNAMGLPNPGIEYFSGVIARLREEGVPTIGSIFAPDAGTFSRLAASMDSMHVDAIELNLSCPHVEGVGSEVGSTPEAVLSIVREVCGSVSTPVWAKMTPNSSDIVALAQAAEKGGAAAIVAVNTLRAMAISGSLRKPVLANRFGGLSGHALKYIGLRAVYEISSSCSIPVVGVGGIQNGMDAVEYIMAGASAVEIGTAIAAHGPELFSKVNREIEAFMQAEGFESIREMVGVAH